MLRQAVGPALLRKIGGATSPASSGRGRQYSLREETGRPIDEDTAAGASGRDRALRGSAAWLYKLGSLSRSLARTHVMLDVVVDVFAFQPSSARRTVADQGPLRPLSGQSQDRSRLFDSRRLAALLPNNLDKLLDRRHLSLLGCRREGRMCPRARCGIPAQLCRVRYERWRWARALR